MYKVMIVDDENLIRITLKNMIDWKALDCEVIAMAKDGVEAMQIYHKLYPEIVITDLKMPEMDGIELIHKIREVSKNTQILVLSNYSDFELVRDAMKAGAFDYLLKITLEEKDLVHIIEQVKESCESSSLSSSEETGQAIKELQQCLILKKNEHLMEAEDFVKVLSQNTFLTFEDGYELAYFRVDNIDFEYISKIKDHNKLHQNLHDLIKETIPLSMHHLVIFISNHSGLIIFHSKEKARIMNICMSIMRNIMQYMDISLSITLSKKLSSFAVFHDEYLLLLKAQQRRFYSGNCYLVRSEVEFEFKQLNMHDLDFHTQIVDAVKVNDFDKVNTFVALALQYMGDHLIYPQQVREYFIFILNNIEGYEISKGIKEMFPFDRVHSLLHICESVEVLTSTLMDCFGDMKDWINDTKTDKYSKVTMEILSFVDQHFEQKITLKTIAEEFDMNESYLSRIFKNETGNNLISYINEMKMRKAMELLHNPDIMIKDAAASVGMDDQFYFNKVFKKFYELSPSEFRKKLSSKE